MNKNSGYVGWSMSKRAAAAYDDGEMPKSKWTKAAMVEAIKEACEVNGLEYDPAIEAMKKDDLFSKYFKYASWHHTSKHCNCTCFYCLDEDYLIAHFKKLPVTKQPKISKKTIENTEEEKEMMRKITRARESAHMTVEEMSRQLGIPLKTVEEWEDGKNLPATWIQSMLLEKLDAVREKKMSMKQEIAILTKGGFSRDQAYKMVGLLDDYGTPYGERKIIAIYTEEEFKARYKELATEEHAESYLRDDERQRMIDDEARFYEELIAMDPGSRSSINGSWLKVSYPMTTYYVNYRG